MLDGQADLVTVQRMHPVAVHLHMLSVGQAAKRSYLCSSLDGAQKLHVSALVGKARPIDAEANNESGARHVR